MKQIIVFKKNLFTMKNLFTRKKDLIPLKRINGLNKEIDENYFFFQSFIFKNNLKAKNFESSSCSLKFSETFSTFIAPNIEIPVIYVFRLVTLR